MYLGTDPEFAVVDKFGNSGPAHKFGFPEKYEKINGEVGIASLFRDGWMVEMNTRPSTCRTDVIQEIARGKKRANGLLPEGYHLSAQAAVKVDPISQLVDAPADVCQFGCQPSYDAYKLEAKLPQIDPLTYKFRPAGGHLHFATDNVESARLRYPYNNPQEVILLDPDTYPAIVKEFDKYIGLMLTFIYDDSMQWERRKHYGQAGEFRPQEYPVVTTGFRNYGAGRQPAVGVEYRTPPPQVFDDDRVAALAMGVGRWVIHHFSDLPKDKSFDDHVVDAINTGNGVVGMLKRFPCPLYDMAMLRDYREDGKALAA